MDGIGCDTITSGLSTATAFDHETPGTLDGAVDDGGAEDAGLDGVAGVDGDADPGGGADCGGAVDPQEATMDAAAIDAAASVTTARAAVRDRRGAGVDPIIGTIVPA